MYVGTLILAITNVLFFYVATMDNPPRWTNLYFVGVACYLVFHYALLDIPMTLNDILRGVYLLIGTIALYAVNRLSRINLHLTVAAPLIMAFICLPAVMSGLIFFNYFVIDR